jgi:hypothetical protein
MKTYVLEPSIYSGMPRLQTGTDSVRVPRLYRYFSDIYSTSSYSSMSICLWPSGLFRRNIL